MPYTPKTWTDRVVEKPMTYTVTNNPDGSITLTPAEGTVITVGDLVKAEYLNAMEQGIKSAHDVIALKAPLASPALTGTPTVPTAAVDTSTTQAASTAFVTNQASASNPVMDGTVAIGTSKRYARADHVHPTDTSRAPLASPALTGTPTVPTAAVGTNTTQAASTAFVVAEIPNRVPQASETVAGKIEIATSAEAAAGTDTARAITPSGLRGGLNASGSAPIYACRAWVNCVGVGGTINGSGNVSSVAHDAQGVWTVNFATALPDANYAIVGSTRYDATFLIFGQYQTIKSTTQAKIIVRNSSGTATNPDQMSIAVFR